MTSAPRSRRRRLPARVYWVRRILVLAVALVLVAGIGAVLNAVTGGDDGGGEQAAPAAADSSPTAGASLVKVKKKPRKKRATASPPATPRLAEPEGVCAPADIQVNPFVYQAVAWHRSTLWLELKTRESRACTWRTSAQVLTVRITDKVSEVWTSRQCPLAVPVRDLVLRNDVGIKVPITWSGRRSDEGCSATTRWARPGWYRVEGAAYGGEPGQLLFELIRPADAAHPVSAAPTPTAPTAAESTSSAQPDTQPTDYVADPSGAPEPNR